MIALTTTMVQELSVDGPLTDAQQPDPWLEARPYPAPVGQPHEAQVLANRFVNVLRVAYRHDSEEWLRLVKSSQKPAEFGDREDCWSWHPQSPELLRAYMFGFLDCLRYFTAHRKKKPEFQARFADCVLREAKQLPFRIGRRHENALVDWVLSMMRPSKDYQQSRRHGVATAQACDLYLQQTPDWLDGRRKLETEMKAAIGEAFAHEWEVVFNYHIWFTDSKGVTKRGRGFKGLTWVSTAGDPIASPFIERRDRR